MPNLNKVYLMGNLTAEPEINYTPKGTAITEIRIAINRKVKNGDEWVNEVTFVDVTIWGKNAENVATYLRKGSGIHVEGRLQLDSWEDKQTGQKRTKLRVIAEATQFLDKPKPGDGAKTASGNPHDFAEDEEIPF